MNPSKDVSQIVTETRLRQAVQSKTAKQWYALIRRKVKDRAIRAWCASVVFWRLSDYEAEKEPRLVDMMDDYRTPNRLDEGVLVEVLERLGLFGAKAPKRYEVSRKRRAARQDDGRVSSGYRHGC